MTLAFKGWILKFVTSTTITFYYLEIFFIKPIQKHNSINLYHFNRGLCCFLAQIALSKPLNRYGIQKELSKRFLILIIT